MLVLAHEVAGRLRFADAALRREPAALDVLRAHVAAHEDVRSVAANPITGSLTVHYRGAPEQRARIIEHLRRAAPVEFPPVRPASPAPQFPALGRTLADAVLDRLFERATHALVAALL